MARHVIDISTNTTLSAVHAGCDVLATGGQITITLPAPIADCDIRIINGDAGNGKILAGFPADVNTKLYPGQAIAVDSDGLTWFAEEKPGRWKIPSPCLVYVSSFTLGASDANDGLTPQTPLRHMSMAGHVVQTDFDISQTTPIIAPIAGSTFTDDPLGLGGQPTGGNLIQISTYVDPAAPTVVSFLSQCAVGAPIIIGDNAELNLQWNALNPAGTARLKGNTSNAADNAAGIYQHNNGLFDMGGICTIVGSGTNGSAIFFDGPCPGASIANGFNCEGTFGDVFRMDEGGGRCTLSGDLHPVNDALGHPPFGTRLLSILGENELILGGPISMGGWASLGPSIVGGDGLLVTNGVAIPGGVTTTQGGRVVTTKF
jgi:hypothetical protein